ncbi:Uncharacterized protein PECH_004143 [Penicillium ucsense]|uniref:Uncharacterized protein n=1 Tax=Penicillium ucsense TaxID=2839758 RepID=A0A8J8W8D0_9EURO|nr:Uncharacterized protein PECM_005550 [Penicillium ucsense]KAF7737228.1 Uncharacterized protein PECH_004143 [Penicillium ucsense]
MAESDSRGSPEDSKADDKPDQDGAGKTAANAPVKDRKCQYCGQAFTSSSLGRHLDQFVFKKKADGVHDVEEIRRIRSGITRRQARTSSGKHDGSPERTPKRGQEGNQTSAEAAPKAREPAVRMMFNTPTWHATGVINDIPDPSRPAEGHRVASAQSQASSLHLPEFATRGATANNPDTTRALELALREALDNIKAATTSVRPRPSPFDFDIQSQTFPSLCLRLLPPPPSLFAAHPFSSPMSFPIQPPGIENLDVVRQAIRSRIVQWRAEQLSQDTGAYPSAPGSGMDSAAISRAGHQHEESSIQHLELAFNHWNKLSHDTRREAWQLEIQRAYVRECESRKSVEDRLARVQQEANQLRAQVERLGSCQWPREFALFPPDTLPIPRDVARELGSKCSAIGPESSRWDFDHMVSKWKRVVMHDKNVGRSGVSQGPSLLRESDDSHHEFRVPRSGEEPSLFPNRLRPLQPNINSNNNTTTATNMNGLSPDPANTGTSASSVNYTSPYSHQDARSPPQGSGNAGPPLKRQRFTNGSDGLGLGEPSSLHTSGPGTWPSSTPMPMLSNLAAPSGQTPPSAPRG